MPSLSYTHVSDYKRGFSSKKKFSQLIYEDRKVVEFEAAPDDPWKHDGWDVAAYKLLEAEEEASQLISKEYDLSNVEELPENVKGRIIDLAVHKLYVRSPQSTVPKGVAERRDRALSRFKKIADGHLTLDLPEGSATPEIYTGPNSDSEFYDL